MPTSVRKSSVNNSRRGPQPYIPYRGDDFFHGKRTGVPIEPVEHGSDEFEPFDVLLKQATNVKAPTPKVPKRKKRTPKTPVIVEPEYDEDGEMDMDIVNSKLRIYSSRSLPQKRC